MKSERTKPAIIINVRPPEDRLLEQAKNLKEDIIKLNDELLSNKTFFHLYNHLYVSGNPLSSARMKEDNINKFTTFIKKYKPIVKRYSQLIEEAISLKIISQEVVNQITNHSKNPIEIEPNNKINEIKYNYKKRSKKYKKFHITSGMMSIFIIGLPFFISGLAVHAIDKLITTIRLNKSATKTNQPFAKKLSGRFQLGLFHLSQAYYSKKVPQIASKDFPRPKK